MSIIKRKYISLLLIISLLIGMVGIVNVDSSYADETGGEIEHLTVTVTPPVVGQKSSEVRPQISVSEDNAVLSNVQLQATSWMYDPDIYASTEPDLTFEAGQTYYIYAFIKANEGWSFKKGSTSGTGNDEGFQIFDGCTVNGGTKLFAASRTINGADCLRVKISVVPTEPLAVTYFIYRTDSRGTYFIGTGISGSKYTVPTCEDENFSGWEVPELSTEKEPFVVTKAQTEAGYQIDLPIPTSESATSSLTFKAIYGESAHTHTFKTVTKPAGYLKNGSTYKECTGCGYKTATKVLKGWSKSYVKSLNVKKAKKAFTVKWKKQSKKNQKKFNGYQIRYAKKSNFKNAKCITVSKKASGKKIKGKSKTKYFVQVRTYKKVGKEKYYSAWSKTKVVKTK